MLLHKQALLRQQRQTSGAVRPSRAAPLICVQCHLSDARCGTTEPQSPVKSDALISSRRHLLGSAVLGCAAMAVAAPLPSEAITSNPFEYKQELKKRRRKIPESEFTDGPQGLKYYDLEVGGGPEATVGQRVAVHYEIKYRNITFMTSRVGMGVTGGNPLGFNVGEAQGDAGSTLAGLDLAVRGMRVGGLRRAIVPPELGYGSRGIGEIPPNSPLTIDVELLSIKTGPLGFRTKLVEG